MTSKSVTTVCDSKNNVGSRNISSTLNGLLAPLQQLDKRLQQTLEVADTLCGTAFQQYLLGGIVPALSPADVMVESSPLAKLQANFGLSNFDIGVVVMVIAPELDRRYERLYSKLQSNSSRKPTMALALGVLCNSDCEKQVERARWATNSPLRHLLQPLRINDQRRDNTDAYSEELENQALQLQSSVSRYLLNQRSLDPLQNISTYCQLSWPQTTHSSAYKPAYQQHHQQQTPPEQTQTHHKPGESKHREVTPTVPSTENTLLSALIARLKQGTAPLPLSLRFSGQCIGTGKKQKAVEQMAVAAQVPLLRVNLTQLIHKAKLNVADCVRAVQQVILQSQLWNAILYLEDLAELPVPMPQFIHPALIEKLSIQLGRYRGITIFAGRSPHIPEANNGKGIISIPFSQSERPQKHTILNPAQLALEEIEKFRMILMQSSVEFGL
ncbi:MAG: hypothetical protein AAGC93_01070 [Cyanobacteria bacterium P01_F01_bin.53]